MSYRVDYQASSQLHGTVKYRSRRISFTMIGLLLFILLVNCCWPEGIDTIRNVFLSETAVSAASVLEEFTFDHELNTSISNTLVKLYSKLGRVLKVVPD